MLFSLKKKGNSGPCYNMDEPWGHYAKWNKPSHKKPNIAWFHLYEVSRIVKLIESRIVVARGFQKEGTGSLQVQSLWVLETDGCDDCTTVWLHLMPLKWLNGEGNGSPLQCSDLESPRDGGAWWAAGYGVAQSQTWLKRLSSSSSRNLL